MTIKRYLVKDMNEATTRIRNELGNDAIIISSRWIRKKGIKNLFGRKVLEVTATVDHKQQSAYTNPIVDNYPQHQPIHSSKEIQLEKEINELKKMVSSLMEKEKANKKGGRKIQFSTVMQRHLSKMDLDEQIIKGFTSFCRDEGSSKVDYNMASQYFAELLKNSIFQKDKVKENIWVFKGPTGVGKTTTIAKIASKETLTNRKRVGLITMDTYRIGAVEQLKTYADILSIPIEVVSSKEEMAAALENLQKCDLILIDSTGRNSQMQDQLLESEECLSEINEKHSILVISGTTRRADLKLILENYNEVGYDSIIITKLDETQCYGSILNCSKYTDKPICYITTGQIVPEDIKEATMENLLEYVFMGVDI